MEKLFPSDNEELLKIWEGLKWAVFFLIMRDTGFRPGEVAGLTRKAFYPEVGGVYITGSIDTETGEYKDSIKTSKTGKSYKLGLLEDQTIYLLNEYIAETHPDLNDLIFPANNTEGIKTETSLKHFKLSPSVMYHGWELVNRQPLLTIPYLLLCNIPNPTVLTRNSHPAWNSKNKAVV